jgi:hypothetical protein
VLVEYCLVSAFSVPPTATDAAVPNSWTRMVAVLAGSAVVRVCGHEFLD